MKTTKNFRFFNYNPISTPTFCSIGVAMAALLFLLGCDSQPRHYYSPRTSQGTVTSYNTTATQKSAAEGLNLAALTELVKKSKDAKELELKLNSETGDRINNLDLNQDNKVDYLNVTEYGSGNIRGFSFTVELAKDDIQEVATIELEKKQNQVEVTTSGNQNIYGSNHHYRSSFGMTDFLIMSWMFNSMSRPMYHSPYHYGGYPSHYGRGYSTLSNNQYRDRSSRYASGSSLKKTSLTGSRSSIKSPNAAKSSAKVKASLKNPTQSQKAFQARSRPMKTAASRSGGFGRSSSSAGAKRSGGFGRSSTSKPAPTVRRGTFRSSSSLGK
ncbi:MAG TPA: hypothetical protein EYQ50_20775 [Verrucomicrobiales bacterium]|nr:hypothetical protein [Verrucomicrobiales bacterium]